MKPIKPSGSKFILEPPTIAALISPDLILLTAKCIAEREEEQAVSTIKLGPVMS